MTESVVQTGTVSIPAGEVTLVGDLVVPAEAGAVVLFAHGSGSSRFSPRNRYVAGRLRTAGLGTLQLPGHPRPLSPSDPQSLAPPSGPRGRGDRPGEPWSHPVLAALVPVLSRRSGWPRPGPPGRPRSPA